MSKRPDPWLNIIGIGEDGMSGLSDQARTLLRQAEVIVGGDRHHNLVEDTHAVRVAWPSPFDAMISEIVSHKGKRIVILVTGDPLWYSVGARILKSIPREEIRFFPQLSSFQWASCRMGWSLADCDTVTVHGRAVEQIIPHFAPGVRILALTRDGETPGEVSKLLCDNGYSRSRLTVLASLGGPDEKRIEGTAGSWDENAPDFHVLAIECVADEGLAFFSRIGGLPDASFEHDGQITKQAIRSTTLAALSPYPDALLWDVGAGCGSIGIEWMRAARGAIAIAVETSEERCEMMKRNAKKLGTPKLEIVSGRAPQALKELPTPDAVFIGGGLTNGGVFEHCWEMLRGGGRLVVNAVTLESEAKLFSLQEEYGGELRRLAVQSAQPVGKYRGWRTSMPVTQWIVSK